MNRNLIDIKYLSNKGYTNKQILFIMKIALDKKISDDCFQYFLSNKFTNEKEMEELYNIIYELKDKNSEELLQFMNYILQFNSKVKREIINLLNRCSYNKIHMYNSIIQKYYTKEYDVYGIWLLNFIYEHISCYYDGYDRNFTYKFVTNCKAIHLTENEIEYIYKYTVKYLSDSMYIQKIDNDDDYHYTLFYDLIDEVLMSIYKIKFNNNPCEPDQIKLDEDIIRIIVSIIFGGEKSTKNYSRDYKKQAETLIKLAYDNKVPFFVLEQYIGSTMNVELLENTIKQSVINEKESKLLPVDKIIYLMRSIPEGLYSNFTPFDAAFKFRFVNSDILRIILDPNTSEARIDNFYSYNVYQYSSDDPDNITDKINSYDIECIKEFFDPTYSNYDINEFGRTILRLPKTKCESFFNLVFKRIKSYMSDLSSKENEIMHYKVTRLMGILIEIGQRDKFSKCNQLAMLFDNFFTEERIKNQIIDDLNYISRSDYGSSIKVFNDDLCSYYFDIIDDICLLSNIYCNDDLVIIYDTLNSYLVEYNDNSKKPKKKSKIYKNPNVLLNTIDNIFNYKDINKEFVSMILTYCDFNLLTLDNIFELNRFNDIIQSKVGHYNNIKYCYILLAILIGIDEEIKSKLDKSKILRKSMGIGNQLSQITGVYYPTPMDNYCKIKKGIKFYGRYMDDSYAIVKTKDEAKQLLKELIDISSEVGVHINLKKTKINSIYNQNTFLKINYIVTDTGKIIEKPVSATFRREMKRLRMFKKLMNEGRMTFDQILLCYKSWRGSYSKYDCGLKIKALDDEMRSLFHLPYNYDFSLRKDRIHKINFLDKVKSIN